jgi:pSer/pThr/pTyr-binding forkhead associated (FHA) protein
MTKALTLKGISGSRVGMRDLLTGRTNIVGSSSACDLVLKDRLICPRHAEIRQALDRWFVKPLDPNAAVFVNSKPVTGQGRIQEGDMVTFGGASFQVGFTQVVEQAVGANQSPSRSGVPQLGEYLLRRGIVSRSQLAHAAEQQEILRRQGRKANIGEVLHELGYVTSLEIEQAVQEQQRDFFERFRD